MNFSGYIGHRLKEQNLQELLAQLNAHKLTGIREFIDALIVYNPDERNKVWKLSKDIYDGGTWEMDGPCGLSLTFSEHVCYISHYTRWLTFLLNDLEVDFRGHLRNVSRELAQYFQADYALYVPDSAAKESGIMDFIWIEENKDIVFMRQWLAEKCGPPKDKIEDIYVEYEDTWDSKGYYIDVFTDDEQKPATL